MRETGVKNGIHCKVYAGSNTVLLAMDLPEEQRDGLLGFTIYRTALSGRNAESKPLQNLLHFAESGGVPGQPLPSTRSPFQKFRWGDYGAQPGARYSYRVDAFYGKPDRPRFVEGPTIDVTMHGPKDENYVVFNRAVVASQAFWRKVPEWLNLGVGEPIPKFKQGEPLPAQAYRWLSRGVEEAISGFIERAADDSWALDIAIYEYEWPVLAQAVAAAAARGAHIRLLYHAKPDSKEERENKATLKKFPPRGPNVTLIPRVPSKLMHNKFMVLSRLTDDKREPVAVLTGSTNWTENGLFRQANVVHVSRDSNVVASYLRMFAALVESAASAKDTRKWINKNNAIDQTARIFCGFSPRTGLLDNAEFVRVINNVERDVMFATAFDMHDDIEKALIGSANDPILRLGIQNKLSGAIAGVNRDRTDSFVAPALFGTDADDWFRMRGSAGQPGSLYIHLKAIVIDFTGDNPTIISGSHNLSKGASDSNDENYLIARGGTDLADVYGLEILRFFDHYRFRYLLKQLQSEEEDAPRNTLVSDHSWTDDYFDPGSLHEAERLRFMGQ